MLLRYATSLFGSLGRACCRHAEAWDQQPGQVGGAWTGRFELLVVLELLDAARDLPVHLAYGPLLERPVVDSNLHIDHALTAWPGPVASAAGHR